MKIWRTALWVIIAIILLLTIVLIATSKKTSADTTNIDPIFHFSWNKVFGWADFYTNQSVNVSSQKLTGYANSSVGDISLDCSTPGQGLPSVCGTSNYGVKNNGGGFLSGYGWNKTVGWISFNCDNEPNVCGQTNNYKVNINPAAGNGDFSGWAWNKIVGWISFNCNQNGGNCDQNGSNYKVKTFWSAQAATGNLESSIFDTTQTSGAILNGIIWQGDTNGGHVRFQIAVSDDQSGPWNYYGPGQYPNTYFEGANFPGQTIKIEGGDRAWVNNKQYLRYKVFLESDISQTKSPIINDIILNWSR